MFVWKINDGWKLEGFMKNYHRESLDHTTNAAL